jgi:hypothetical protein
MTQVYRWVGSLKEEEIIMTSSEKFLALNSQHTDWITFLGR